MDLNDVNIGGSQSIKAKKRPKRPTYRCRRFAMKRRIQTKRKKEETSDLTICYWNSNGFKNMAKQQDVLDVLETGAADCVLIDETHFRAEENTDLSMFNKYTIHNIVRRGY